MGRGAWEVGVRSWGRARFNQLSDTRYEERWEDIKGPRFGLAGKRKWSNILKIGLKWPDDDQYFTPNIRRQNRGSCRNEAALSPEMGVFALSSSCFKNV